MREHDYLRENSFAYRQACNDKRTSESHADTYRQQYLELREMMCGYFRDNPDVPLPDDIMKAIGMRMRLKKVNDKLLLMVAITLISAGLFLLTFSQVTNAAPTIYVDQGDYTLRIVDNGKEILKQRVIVGRKSRPTPNMHDQITHVVLNPTWTAPKRLARLDVVPKIKKHVNPMDTINWFGYQFFQDGVKVDPSTIPWYEYSKNDIFPYTVVQRAGARNALGSAKFIMTNGSAIRLHGTPNAKLFDQDERRFSSGCIRVEDEIALAKYLLPNKRIDAMLNTGKSEQWIKLPVPVKVVIEKKRKPIPKVVEPKPEPKKVAATTEYFGGINQF